MQSEVKAGIHPLVAAASVAVIVLAAVGVAAFTGLLPGTSGSGSPVAPQAAAPAPAETKAAEPKPQAEAPAAKKVHPPKVAAHKPAPAPVAAAPQATPVPVPATPAPICADCGVVEAVQEVQVKGQATGVGAVAGGVGGAVIGNQFGHGGSKTLSRVLGAVGGAVIGNEVEKNARTTTQYQVAVRMDDGSLHTLTSAQPPAWRAGDKVRLVGDQLQPR